MSFIHHGTFPTDAIQHGCPLWPGSSQGQVRGEQLQGKPYSCLTKEWSDRRTVWISEKSKLYVTREQKWSCSDYHEGPRTTSGLVCTPQKHSGNRSATHVQPLFPSHCNGSPQNYNFRSTLTSHIKLWIKIGRSGAHSLVNCRSRNLNREK